MQRRGSELLPRESCRNTPCCPAVRPSKRFANSSPQRAWVERSWRRFASSFPAWHSEARKRCIGFALRQVHGATQACQSCCSCGIDQEGPHAVSCQQVCANFSSRGTVGGMDDGWLHSKFSYTYTSSLLHAGHLVGGLHTVAVHHLLVLIRAFAAARLPGPVVHDHAVLHHRPQVVQHPSHPLGHVQHVADLPL